MNGATRILASLRRWITSRWVLSTMILYSFVTLVALALLVVMWARAPSGYGGDNGYGDAMSEYLEFFPTLILMLILPTLAAWALAVALARRIKSVEGFRYLLVALTVAPVALVALLAFEPSVLPLVGSQLTFCMFCPTPPFLGASSNSAESDFGVR
jgi:hypothetical protein